MPRVGWIGVGGVPGTVRVRWVDMKAFGFFSPQLLPLYDGDRRPRGTVVKEPLNVGYSQTDTAKGGGGSQLVKLFVLQIILAWREIGDRVEEVVAGKFNGVLSITVGGVLGVGVEGAKA